MDKILPNSQTKPVNKAIVPYTPSNLTKKPLENLNPLQEILDELNVHERNKSQASKIGDFNNDYDKKFNTKDVLIEVISHSGNKVVLRTHKIISHYEKMLSTDQKIKGLLKAIKLDKNYNTNYYTKDYLTKIARKEFTEYSATLIADTLLKANIPSQILMKTLGADFIDMAIDDVPILLRELKKDFKRGYYKADKNVKYRFIEYQKDMSRKLSSFLRRVFKGE